MAVGSLFRRLSVPYHIQVIADRFVCEIRITGDNWCATFTCDTDDGCVDAIQVRHIRGEFSNGLYSEVGRLFRDWPDVRPVY